MKILMCNSFLYLRGGAERYALDLTDLLIANGHEVIPFAMEHERNFSSEYAPYFVSTIDFPSKLREKNGLAGKIQVLERVLYSHESKQKIAALIERTQPDIAHVHGIAHEVSPSILDAIKEAGIPLIQTLHDYKLLCPNTSFVSQGQVCERCKGHKYYNVMLRRCKRDSLAASVLSGIEMYTHKLLQVYEKNVDVFLTPSRFLQEKVAEYGIPNKVMHVPNFVDVDRFQPCYENDGYFIYVGRLVNVKGIKTLFKAMRRVKTSHLYVIGEGEIDNELRQYAQQHGITNITFKGHLGTEELIPMIQRAAFMVVPSEWYENYPMSVLESLACGTPVIGAHIGGIPEIVHDGENGLLFEPGNVEELAERIQMLLDNPRQTITMGRTGRQQIEQINHPQQHCTHIVNIYQSLLPRTHTKPRISSISSASQV
jgi:glycosyltransferase involved in cell wall biosynthesis